MVSEDDLDLQSLGGGAEVLNGHAGGDHRALAGQVGVKARLVVEHTDLDDAVGNLRGGRAGEQGQNADEGHNSCDRHALYSFMAGARVSGGDSYSKVVVQLGHVSVELRVRNHVHNAAVLHHIVAVGHGRGEAKVLLDEQDRESLALEPA